MLYASTNEVSHELLVTRELAFNSGSLTSLRDVQFLKASSPIKTRLLQSVKSTSVRLLQSLNALSPIYFKLSLALPKTWISRIPLSP